MTDLVNFTGNLPAFWKNGTKSEHLLRFRPAFRLWFCQLWV